MPEAYMPDHVVEGLRADVHRLEREVAELRRQLRTIREHSEQVNRAFCRCAEQNSEMADRLNAPEKP